jgi:SAM-dependent methyltransferase
MNPDAYVQMAETESRHWWFVARRILLSSIISRMGLPLNIRILEVGAGTGGNLEMLSRFGHVSAMEMDGTARAIAKKKTRGCFDIRSGSCPSSIPFPEAAFDLICLFDVLEHIEEDVASLTALKRLLTPQGRILLTVPAYQWLWSEHDEFLHHKRRYLASDLRERIEGAGLQIEKLSYFNTLLFPLAVIARAKDRLFNAASASGTSIPVAPINKFFYLVFSAERFLLRMFSLPFGVSLYAIVHTQRSPVSADE